MLKQKSKKMMLLIFSVVFVLSSAFMLVNAAGQGMSVMFYDTDGEEWFEAVIPHNTTTNIHDLAKLHKAKDCSQISSIAGYTFAGWGSGNEVVYDKDGNFVKNNIYTANASSVAIRPLWNGNPYVITYSSNNNKNEIKTAKGVVGEEVTIPEALPDNGMERFVSWNTKADGTGTDYFPGQEVKGLTTDNTITLYARWTPDLILRFDSNEGTGFVSGEMKLMTKPAGTTFNLPDCSFVKKTENGTSKFLGWSLSRNKEDVYPAGSQIKLNGDTTVYAIWDDYPRFSYSEYPDRYFTIEDLNAGLITEESLLSTVRVIDDHDRELQTYTKDTYDGGPGITIVDYDANEIKKFTRGGSFSLRYKVVDSSQNTIYLDAMVYVTNNLLNNSREFIRSVTSETSSGLSKSWNTPAKKTALANALREDNPSYSFEMNQTQVDAAKEFVKKHKRNDFGNIKSYLEKYRK